jgi:flagellar basal-body rod protein FlgC
MVDTLSIALSGLTAHKQRLATAAGNIANVSTAGTVPDNANSTASASTSTVYQPLQTNFIAMEAGGGVATTVTPRANGYSLVYDPENSYANSEGLYAVPNVDFAQEFVDITLSKHGFKANLAVIKVYDHMMEEALDTLV